MASFNYEKREGRGEDADPLTLVNDESVWIGVFDGMGGAGAQMIETPEGLRSAAHVASRHAVGLTADWIRSSAEMAAKEAAQDLHDFLKAGLDSKQRELAPVESRIRSRLIRKLPTTAAILQICDHQAGTYELRAFWAGDSRVFALTPSHGLLQLTVDHLKGGPDPYENLSSDAPMSNCLEADEEFFIEEALLRLEEPFIAIAATDGCFGYFNTPMEFEELLVESVYEAQDFNAWRDILIEKICKATGDDASMAFVVVGLSSIDEFKAAMQEGRLRLYDNFMSKLNTIESTVRLTRVQLEELKRAEEEQLSSMKTLWQRYKETYQPELPRLRSK
ncbi:hypothetical protein DBR22_04405 [Arthrobacter sp. HMWF013]|nr:hypothetical protein DBR22_04405 [Arthrobacter sp. HMWF013]